MAELRQVAVKTEDEYQSAFASAIATVTVRTTAIATVIVTAYVILTGFGSVGNALSLWMLCLLINWRPTNQMT